LTSDSTGVLVGEELADLLDLNVGDDMILLGAHPEASLGAIRSPIVGVFKAHEATIGRMLVYASLGTARQLARNDTAATAIVIRVDGVVGPQDAALMDQKATALRAALPDGFEVKTGWTCCQSWTAT